MTCAHSELTNGHFMAYNQEVLDKVSCDPINIPYCVFQDCFNKTDSWTCWVEYLLNRKMEKTKA